jgi:hypothetical protein
MSSTATVEVPNGTLVAHTPLGCCARALSRVLTAIIIFLSIELTDYLYSSLPSRVSRFFTRKLRQRSIHMHYAHHTRIIVSYKQTLQQKSARTCALLYAHQEST